jgi:hypothetical protein
MNLGSNPWSFTSADIPSAITASASPNGMVQQAALGAVLLTTTSAHGLSVGQIITYINDTNGRFQGCYMVVAVPSTTTALLANISSPTSGQPFNSVIAASGGGSVLLCRWNSMIRSEDISVLATGTPGATALTLLDRNGNVVWTFIGVATAEGFAAQNRGKVMWIDGLTPQSIPTNCTVLITIN